MPPHIARGNASRARIIRSVGVAGATTRLGLANLVTNFLRLTWFETRGVSA